MGFFPSVPTVPVCLGALLEEYKISLLFSHGALQITRLVTHYSMMKLVPTVIVPCTLKVLTLY
jgi:hypothetical protein